MSEFGDISRMDLSHLKKEDEIEEELELAESLETEEGTDGPGTALEPAGGGALTTGEAEDSEEEPEVEVVDEGEKLKQPVGQHYYIDATMTPKEMRAFLFAHNYRSPLMIAALVIAILWPVYTVVKAEGSLPIALLCTAVVLIFMPFSIWYRGKASITQNPIYKNTFHYMLDEEGVHLKIDSRVVDVPWKQVTKVLTLKSCVVVYTGKINAYLIPTEAMGSQKEEILSFIRSRTR